MRIVEAFTLDNLIGDVGALNMKNLQLHLNSVEDINIDWRSDSKDTSF